jgi:tetratricopeptide (TPR) repeat protein
MSEKKILEELERILSSKVFSRSERMKRFLKYAVDQALSGHAAAVKEYAVALAVYDKPESFDPRIDPIVRVEASRLRAKLREYYEEEGRNDPVGITIRKAGYAALFKKRHEIVPNSTENAEAQHFYLRGRHYWNRRNPEAITEATSCFKKAIALDPRYALAYAGLADCYASHAWLEMDSPDRVWKLAEQAAQKALSLEKSLAQATTTLACRQALYSWDWTAAEALFRDSIARDPRYATARHWYAIFCLAPQRRLTAAVNEIARACELDPLSSVIGTHLGCLLYFRRRYEEAVEQYLRALEVDPTFPAAYWHLGFAYVQLAQFDDALRVLNQAAELGGSLQATTAALGFVYGAMGRTKDAVRMIEDLEGMADTGYVSPVNLALVHTALNNRDAAFHWLGRARDERASRIVHLKVEPGLDRLKTDPRFLSILSSLNLS